MLDTNYYTLRRSKVISTTDAYGGMRIKVRLYPEDNSISSDDDLVYCFPLLPKMLQVQPKVGESVLVILANQNDDQGDRFYIGPIIAQDNKMQFAPHETEAYTLMDGSVVGSNTNPRYNPENKGSFPEQEDIALRGRKDTDVVLKEDELRLRCGIHKKNVKNQMAFNDENIGYIQMKDVKNMSHNGRPFNTVTNIVSDKINLLSYQTIDNFKLTDPDALITDDELSKILDEAHQLPYGDILVDFLRKFVLAFLTHTHNFPGNPTLPTKEVQDISNYDLNRILCESIRIS